MNDTASVIKRYHRLSLSGSSEDDKSRNIAAANFGSVTAEPRKMYSPPWFKWQHERYPTMSAADERIEELKPFIEQARSSGCQSTREIAAFLNSAGLCTPRGRPWGPSQVLRAIRKLKLENARLASRLPSLGSDELRRHVLEAKSLGYGSFREIAGYLNARGVLTSRGLQWHPTAVSRMMTRIGLNPISNSRRSAATSTVVSCQWQNVNAGGGWRS